MTQPRHTSRDGIDVLGAYRSDQMRRAGETFGDADGTWVQLGMLLAHAAALQADQRGAHLRAAEGIGRNLLGHERWVAGYRTDPSPPTDDNSLASRIRTIAEAMEDAGAFATADALLDAYVGADSLASPLEHARIQAVRSRLAAKVGNLDVAAERCRRASKAARELGSMEMQVRALLCKASIARLVGNYPRARVLAARAATLAEGAGLRRLAAIAHHAIMVGAGIGGAFEESLMHGWQAFTLASGDPVLESDVLGNLGQLFVEAGHPATAVAAFRAVLSRHPPERVLLPAHGGLAIAAAMLGDGELVVENEEEVMRRAAAGAPPYDVASALLDLSRAHHLLHHRRNSDQHRLRSLEIATRYGYNEFMHRASLPFETDSPPVRRLPSRVEAVATAVRGLALA